MYVQSSISLTTTVAPLDWWVADDYKLVDFPDPPKPPRTLIVPRGFHQCRRYTICADARTRVALIVRTRGEPKTLAGEHSIFLDLANAVTSFPHRDSPEACQAARAEAARAFVKKWGLLSASSADKPLSSTVESCLSNARLMRKALTDAERNGWHLPRERIRFIHGVTLVHGLALQPKNLFQYCWLELLAAFEYGLPFYRCGNRECGRYGLLREPRSSRTRPGVEGSSGFRSGRDRQYCREACRKKAQRARATRARAA
jgi:hypothetical protein